MLRTACLLVLLAFAAVPSLAFGQDAPLNAGPSGALLRSGVAAVQRLESQASAAQMQQTRLKMDRKTKIILIAAMAVAAIVWLEYELRQSKGPLI